ncbi:protein kinase family protein [Motilibacter aurantiacus]|uniref:hypothetical protein n=1 Tax=Motilibacter aurantiacus TaxID=2714955 RepID=UPI001407A6B3|nr:hypothetical protein [Motilibacter aurantiacus]NHC47383.1 hypothetical protein [Motilibacter aurantiacus]
MRPPAVPSGTLVAERYRLEDALGGEAMPTAADASSTHEPPARPARHRRPDTARRWRAIDEVLARPVVVHLLPAGSASERLLRGARATASVVDPHVVRVLDVLEPAVAWGQPGASFPEGQAPAVVVVEWVEADGLDAVLASGPLADEAAGRLASGVAEALRAVEAAGLPVPALRPADVLLPAEGGTRVRLDAHWAAADPRAHAGGSPTAAQVCGALLYAALTARWPGPEDVGLERAPAADGAAWAPRQVRAGLSPDLDDVACRALGLPPGRRGAPPLRSADEVVAALHTIHAPGLDVPALPAAGPAHAPDRPSRWVRALRLAPAAVLAAGLALLGWQVVDLARSDPPPAPRRAAPPEPSPTPTPVLLRAAGASGFDPLGDGVEGVGSRAVDGDPDTTWDTATYFRRPDLGGLKPGVGLLVDLGTPARVARVVADLAPGADVEVFLFAEEPPAQEPVDEPVAAVTGAGERLTVEVAGSPPARYVLLWLTRLPPAAEDPTNYRGVVREVTVTGWPVAAGASGPPG